MLYARCILWLKPCTLVDKRSFSCKRSFMKKQKPVVRTYPIPSNGWSSWSKQDYDPIFEETRVNVRIKQTPHDRQRKIYLSAEKDENFMKALDLTLTKILSKQETYDEELSRQIAQARSSASASSAAPADSLARNLCAAPPSSASGDEEKQCSKAPKVSEIGIRDIACFSLSMEDVGLRPRDRWDEMVMAETIRQQKPELEIHQWVDCRVFHDKWPPIMNVRGHSSPAKRSFSFMDAWRSARP